MEVYITVVICLVLISLALIIKVKNQEKQLKELINNSSSLTDITQKQEIELATVNERLSNLQELESEFKVKEEENQNLKINTSKIIQQLKDLEDVKDKRDSTQLILSQKNEELTNLKEENSKVKTSLDEQKEKYNDFKITSDKRLNEIKDELEQYKIQMVNIMKKLKRINL